MNKHSGQYYIKQAQAHGLKVQQGKGDHVKVYGPAGRGYMVIPQHRELSSGVECAVKKWLKAVGVILVLSLPILAMFIQQ